MHEAHLTAGCMVHIGSLDALNISQPDDGWPDVGQQWDPMMQGSYDPCCLHLQEIRLGKEC